MTVVTNGVVEFERVNRPADFESKRAKVTLSFAVGDDEDAGAVLDVVSDLAHAKVLRMLAKPETAPKPATKAKPPVAAAPEPVVEPVAEAEPAEEVKPITTDAEMDKAVYAARARNVTPEQIKSLVLSYTKQPGVSMKSLDPQSEDRRAFVDALTKMRPEDTLRAAE